MNTLITFAVPCYKIAEYLDTCISSILDGAQDYLNRIEIILVDDGSPDPETPAAVDSWAERLPNLIRAIHQENAGHGGAVNTGLKNAQGLFFKVVDADDWLDAQACSQLMQHLTQLVESDNAPDLLLANYVYEKADKGKQRRISFKGVLPIGRLFGWEDVGHFRSYQNLLMHTAYYRTEVLRSIGLQLPTKIFYVDNIFVYRPLPAVKSLYYLDLDVYRYYIGRDGQSVSESTMISRIDQQLKITREMIDAVQLQAVEPKRLRNYMRHYLLMMMTVCSVFLRLSDLEDAEEQRKAILGYLLEKDPGTYRRIRNSFMGVGVNLPGPLGRKFAIASYRVTQKIFKFN
ncbi:MAG: glycosyltransferase [Coriobacteriales bacterium]|jgi:glycosyltransferase involved in cell wall biosynthesis|nr:glycosyltransferase [Coriobacteriales bacterium]